MHLFYGPAHLECVSNVVWPSLARAFEFVTQHLFVDGPVRRQHLVQIGRSLAKTAPRNKCFSPRPYCTFNTVAKLGRVLQFICIPLTAVCVFRAPPTRREQPTVVSVQPKSRSLDFHRPDTLLE